MYELGHNQLLWAGKVNKTLIDLYDSNILLHKKVLSLLERVEKLEKLEADMFERVGHLEDGEVGDLRDRISTLEGMREPIPHKFRQDGVLYHCLRCGTLPNSAPESCVEAFRKPPLPREKTEAVLRLCRNYLSKFAGDDEVYDMLVDIDDILQI